MHLAAKRPAIRVVAVLACWLVIMTARAVTPEVGKDRLRRLVKLPTMMFGAEWNFDPENGFSFGSSDADIAAQVKSLREEVDAHDDDADAWLRLASLYTQMKDSDRGSAAWTRAADLYRRRVEEEPDDPLLLAGLGEALDNTGHRDEAESVLREAVQLAPKEWKCRLALGRVLDEEARHDISDSASVGASPAGDSSAGQAELAPDRVTLARLHLEEAESCFDFAVTNAPAEGDARLRRGFHRTLSSYLLKDIREASGEQKSENEVLGDCFQPEALTDIEEASQLNPTDYRLIGNVVMYEIFLTGATTDHKAVGPKFDWNSLPDGAQRLIRGSVTRLQDLGEGGDPKAAAGALEVLSALQGDVLHETDGRIRNLHRVLALDPSREEAWEMLAATLARAGRYQELLSVCEDHLRETDSSRAHMLLAKAYERLKDWDDAEEEVVVALDEAPNDLTANLSIAALLLRRSREPDDLQEVNGWLSRCDQLMAASPPQDRTRQTIIDLTLTRSIYLGLTDDVDAARQWAKAVLDSDHGNQLAKDILAAMDY
jgi:tetratricopeptide (TPR) repeat protein